MSKRPSSNYLDPAADPSLISQRLDKLVSYHLRRVQLSLFKQIERLAEAGDLSPAALHLMLIIDENPGITMSRIAAAHGVDRASLALPIQAMERKGWIERVTSPEDSRALALRCTPQGRNRALKLLGKVVELEREFLSELAPKERETLLSLLQHLARRPKRNAKSSMGEAASDSDSDNA